MLFPVKPYWEWNRLVARFSGGWKIWCLQQAELYLLELSLPQTLLIPFATCREHGHYYTPSTSCDTSHQSRGCHLDLWHYSDVLSDDQTHQFQWHVGAWSHGLLTLFHAVLRVTCCLPHRETQWLIKRYRGRSDKWLCCITFLSQIITGTRHRSILSFWMSFCFSSRVLFPKHNAFSFLCLATSQCCMWQASR